jgi:ABC-2 type transport system ATP-binding protein
MDEVLAVGDASFQQKCFDTFARYKKEGRTVVLVTHGLDAVNLYCDRALLLDHGKLAGDGAAPDITARYRRAIGAATDSSHLNLEVVDRWGSRDVVVTRIEMQDERGVEDRNPLTGTFVRIEVGYLIQNDSVTEFNCALRVSRQDGMLMWEASAPVSRYANVGDTQRGTTGTLRYEVPNLPLLDGSYSVTVELGERRSGSAFDHLESAIPFRVVDRGSRHGLLDAGGNWTFPDSP